MAILSNKILGCKKGGKFLAYSEHRAYVHPSTQNEVGVIEEGLVSHVQGLHIKCDDLACHWEMLPLSTLYGFIGSLNI